MDKPQVDRIDGIPPAIAIDQTNPVRTSRSTVGTMTELADHLKLLYARAATLYCRGCGRTVRRDTPQSIYAALTRRAPRPPAIRGSSSPFPVPVPENFSEREVLALLEQQGYTRIHVDATAACSTSSQDRLRIGSAERARVIEALEAALRVGQGRVDVHVLPQDERIGSAGSAQIRRRLRAFGIELPHPRRGLALFHRSALPGLRHPLSGSDAEPVLVQLAARRVRRPAAASAA